MPLEPVRRSQMKASPTGLSFEQFLGVHNSKSLKEKCSKWAKLSWVLKKALNCRLFQLVLAFLNFYYWKTSKNTDWDWNRTQYSPKLVTFESFFILFQHFQTVITKKAQKRWYGLKKPPKEFKIAHFWVLLRIFETFLDFFRLFLK